MRKFKKTLVFLMGLMVMLSVFSCKDEGEEKPEVIANPTAESVIESFYSAWEKTDADGIIALVCEPMWEVEAKSAEISVEELKAIMRETYAQESGSEVYYKVLETKEYSKGDKQYKEAEKWAKDRYKIDIEGYAVVRIAVTYDNGEPITQNMEVIKYKKSWYAKDLLGI